MREAPQHRQERCHCYCDPPPETIKKSQEVEHDLCPTGFSFFVPIFASFFICSFIRQIAGTTLNTITTFRHRDVGMGRRAVGPVSRPQTAARRWGSGRPPPPAAAAVGAAGWRRCWRPPWRPLRTSAAASTASSPRCPRDRKPETGVPMVPRGDRKAWTEPSAQICLHWFEFLNPRGPRSLPRVPMCGGDRRVPVHGQDAPGAMVHPSRFETRVKHRPREKKLRQTPL